MTDVDEQDQDHDAALVDGLLGTGVKARADHARRSLQAVEATPLTIAVEGGPDGVLVHLTGELDMSGADRVVQTATTALNGAVVTLKLMIDASGLAFCDSAGINALIQVRRLADEAGWPLEVLNSTKPVRRVLELTGLIEYLNVHQH